MKKNLPVQAMVLLLAGCIGLGSPLQASQLKKNSALSSKEIRELVINRAFRLISSGLTGDLYRMRSAILIPARGILEDNGKWDDAHVRAMETAEMALDLLIRRIKSNRTDLLRFAGVDARGRLSVSRLQVNMRLIQLAMEGTVSKDPEIATDSAQALSRLIAADILLDRRPQVRARKGASAAESEILELSQRLGQSHARDLLWEPIGPSIDFTVGMLCLVGTVASIVGAPETGGASLLTTAGSAAMAVAKLRLAFKLSHELAHGHTPSKVDLALFLLRALPSGKGMEGVAKLQMGAATAAAFTASEGFEPKDLASSDASVRLHAFNKLIEILAASAEASEIRIHSRLGTHSKSGGASSSEKKNQELD